MTASQDFNFPKNIFKLPKTCVQWRQFFFKVRSSIENNEDHFYCKYWGIDQLYPLTYESSLNKVNQSQISTYFYIKIYFFKKEVIKEAMKRSNNMVPIF